MRMPLSTDLKQTYSRRKFRAFSIFARTAQPKKIDIRLDFCYTLHVRANASLIKKRGGFFAAAPLHRFNRLKA